MVVVPIICSQLPLAEICCNQGNARERVIQR
jgi:hypothetical protein